MTSAHELARLLPPAYLKPDLPGNLRAEIRPTAPDRYAFVLSLEFRGVAHVTEADLSEMHTDARRNLVNRALVELEHQIDMYRAATTPADGLLDLIEIAPNVDDVVHALRRISGEVEHWATRLAHPDDAPDEADPTPPHGIERRTCTVCDGAGRFEHRGDLQLCPQCHGEGVA